MSRIAILGSNGFLGRELVDHFNNYGLEVVPITRENYDEWKGKHFSVFINSNGNSKKFWANNHPLEDFNLSTVSVYNTLLDFTFSQYVYISSIDVFRDNHYGFNKLISESLVTRYCKNYLILRCSALLGRDIEKGLLKEIVSNSPKLYVNPLTRLQFITVKEVSRVILTLIQQEVKNSVLTVAGNGNVGIPELESLLDRELLSLCSPEKEVEIFNEDVYTLSKYFPVKTSAGYVLDYLQETL